MGRFALPVCFNFLQMLGEEKTSLTAFMGKPDLIPILGDTKFPLIFPSLFCLVLLSKFFNLHSRLLALMGLAEDKQYALEASAKELASAGRNLIYKQMFLVDEQVTRLRTPETRKTALQTLENRQNLGLKESPIQGLIGTNRFKL